MTTDDVAVVNVIKGATLVAAAAPGIATLINVVPIPPTAATLIKVLTVAVGVLVVVAIMTLQSAIRTTASWIVAIIMIALGLVGVTMGVAYVRFAASHVIEDPQNAGALIVLPIRDSPQLRKSKESFNNDIIEALASPIGGAHVRQLIGDCNGPSVNRLVLYLLAAQVFLLVAIVGGAWKVAENLKPGSRPPS
jgi:hypothetical protein